MAQNGALIIEGYEIVEEVSRGGQGIVYRAKQTSTGREVAIKVLREGGLAAQATRQRFQREIQLLAQLRHPNIVTIFHSGTTDHNLQFYVMDYVRGHPLDEFARVSRLSLRETLSLFARVCGSIQSAHASGVIHRDLKPSNILVEEGGEPKVLDFGLAKLLADPLDAGLSDSHPLIGTLPYMAPEQAAGRRESIDIRADVYSLGVVLYELLTGRHPIPIDGPLPTAVRRIIETPPVPPIRAWQAGAGVSDQRGRCPIDADVQTILLKTLEKQPERRYQSVGALHDDILRYLAGDPILARPPSAIYRLKKFARKRRTVLAVFAIMLAVSGYALYAGIEANLAQDRARHATAALRLSEAKNEMHYDPEAAERNFKQAIRLRPGFLEAKIEFAYFLKRQRRFEQMIALCEKTLGRHPDAGPIHLLLAMIYAHDNPVRAAQHREAAQASPSDKRYYRAILRETEDPHDAIDLLTDLLSDNGLHIDARLLLAAIYLRIGEFGKLWAEAQRLVDFVPKSALAWNTHGLALSRLGRFGEAIGSYSKAIQYAPRHDRFYLNRADAHSMVGQFDEAIADCDEAIALKPDMANAFVLRGRARRYLSDLDGARTDLEEARRLDPQNGWAHQQLGAVYYEQNDSAAAIDAYVRAIQLRPGDADSHRGRGRLYLEAGDWQNAIDDLSRAITLDPGLQEAYFERAQAYIGAGKPAHAEFDYYAVLARDPKNAQAFYDRAQTRWLLQRYDDALNDAVRAVELEPGPQTRLLLAIARRLNGDEEGALADLAELRDGAAARLSALPTLARDPWDCAIAGSLNDSLTAGELKAAAGGNAEKLSDTFYYFGVKDLLAGRSEDATRSFNQCVLAKVTSQHEHYLAAWHVRRDQRPPP